VHAPPAEASVHLKFQKLHILHGGELCEAVGVVALWQRLNRRVELLK
jgi:hypothetical protein